MILELKKLLTHKTQEVFMCEKEDGFKIVKIDKEKQSN